MAVDSNSGTGGRNGHDALDVAAHVLELRPDLTQIDLHKLLYLVQAGQLAWLGDAAFEERIEAWREGPMTRRVAGWYKSFGSMPIGAPTAGSSQKVSDQTRWVVGQILTDYGHLDGFALAELIKSPDDSPWKVARAEVPEGESSSEEIAVDLIRAYYRKTGMPLHNEPTAHQNELAQRFFDGDGDAFDVLLASVASERPDA